MPSVTLICLPFAGSGASFFKKWQSAAPADWRMLAVQLPGREERLDDEPHTTVAAAVDEAHAWLRPRLDDAGRIVIFGHSLGAVLGYELARRMSADGPIAGLVVSGSPGPGTVREDPAAGLDDDAFLAAVRRLAGYRHPAMDDPEMREMILPMLRADVAMHEGYRPPPGPPLRTPVTAVRGDGDDLVTPAECGQWADTTTAAFTSAELPGGHMYLTEPGGERALLRLIDGSLFARPGMS
ncbi:thioesterase II family protein [Micromonospora sp. RP3T]|uniref:thioesterase II family protein n=1 Tax=Micromonospora sp. RP3T TaxID=2135446 RepID=UPI003D73A4E3